MGHPRCGLRQADRQGRRERVSECVLLNSERRVPRLLFPQGMSPTEDVNRVHGCENCSFVAQLLHYREFRKNDLLDGVGIMEIWNIIGLSSCEQRCECCR